MTKPQHFYGKVVPVNRTRHRTWALTKGQDFSFARRSNAVPLMCAEFLSAAIEFPIVFARAEEGAIPVVVLGLEPGRSLFVQPDGRWDGPYVPAFLRRYPFVFVPTENGQQHALCIDESYIGWDTDGDEGDPLYDVTGAPADLLNRAFEFASNYEAEQLRTREFMRLLKEFDLLEPMRATIKVPDGRERALTGFHVVSRDRLKTLSPKAIADLFAVDAMELIYTHLVSIRALHNLATRSG